MRPRLDEGTLMILLCALDSYVNELGEEIRELEKNRADTEEWLEQHRTFTMGRRAARWLKFRFMRYLVGDKSRPPHIWRGRELGAMLRMFELETRFRRLLQHLDAENGEQ